MELNEHDRKLLDSLLEEPRTFPHDTPAGRMSRRISSDGFYEEPGLKVTQEDRPRFQLYAGLAVLARDTHTYLMQFPEQKVDLFEEVISSVRDEEQKLYGAGAFPYDDPNSPYRDVLKDFPKGLAQAAAEGHPTVKELGDPIILHEWTVKPGKRVFDKFAVKFKEVICRENGPYGLLEHNLLGQAQLPIIIAHTILVAGLVTTSTLWFPLAVYIALLLTDVGLKTYCEP